MSTSTTEIKSQAVLKRVYRTFFGPSKHEVQPAAQEILNSGHNYKLPFAGGSLAVTRWGESGPAVLLMHGWGGARAQMTGFVEPLLQAGYRVVAYDQPAHGESDGRTTNVLEITPTVEIIFNEEGPFEAILAHSFGTLVTSYALINRHLPQPAKLVYFGAFNRLLDSLPRFQALSQLPNEIMDGLRTMIVDQFGKGILESIQQEALVKNIHIPALVFHDRSDEITPVEDSRAIVNAWPEAQYIETNGLGHRGALQDKAIQQQVIAFLKS